MKYLLQMQKHHHTKKCTSKIAIKLTFYQNTKLTISAWLHHRFPKNEGEILKVEISHIIDSLAQALNLTQQTTDFRL
jgi:hypothetical protein